MAEPVKNTRPKGMSKEQMNKMKEELKGLIEGIKSDRTLKDVKRYLDRKDKDAGNTIFMTAEDKFTKELFYKIMAFNSIRESLKYTLGASETVSYEQFIEMMKKFDDISISMDALINEAYDKKVGNRFEIERYQKTKEKSEAKDASADAVETTAKTTTKAKA